MSMEANYILGHEYSHSRPCNDYGVQEHREASAVYKLIYAGDDSIWKNRHKLDVYRILDGD